jgi:hypothetical protein
MCEVVLLLLNGLIRLKSACEDVLFSDFMPFAMTAYSEPLRSILRSVMGCTIFPPKMIKK